MSVRVLVALLALAVVVGAIGGAAVLKVTTDSSGTQARSGGAEPGPTSTTSGPPTQPPSPQVTASSTASALPTGPAGAGTTGVPEGTALSDYSGPSTITKAGTVIDAKKITSCLVIKADDVTIKNSLLQSDGCFFNVLADDGAKGLTLTDVEVDGQNNTHSDSAINGAGYTCLRCDIHGTVDGFKAGSDVIIKDSWIHDLAMTDESHNDGIQSLGTRSLTITGNTIVLADGATSAVILSINNAPEIRNVMISDNLLGGGAYTVYGGYDPTTDDRSKVSDITIIDNRFTTRIHPKGGVYGPLTSTSSPVEVSGNTWYDGPNAGKPVS